MTLKKATYQGGAALAGCLHPGQRLVVGPGNIPGRHFAWVPGLRCRGLSHEPKAVTASMGLGLSVSRHLASLMGGTLVYRAASDGSKFILKVPTIRPIETVAPVPGNTLQTS